MKPTPALAAALAVGAGFAAIFCAASVAPRAAFASAELDRKYSLEQVGFLRAWDNVDGLFADAVSGAAREYFAGQSRFRLQDIAKADDTLLRTKIPYSKLIEDAAVLGQLARSMRVESVIRTKIIKEGPRYRFTIDWLHAPLMEKLATDAFTLEERDSAKGPGGIGDVGAEVRASLDRLVKQIPFKGQVTGRDAGAVTVNVGASSGIRKGDTLTFGTIEEVKRHPLLGTIVDWKIVDTGKAVVEEVDEGMAFARVSDEPEGRSVARFQKLLSAIPAPDAPAPVSATGAPGDGEKEDPPRLGWANGQLWVGGLSRDTSVGGASPASFSGSSLLLGAKAESQLWLNREWFAELAFGFGLGTAYSQTDNLGVLARSSGVGASVFHFRADVGYTYFTSPDLFGPKGWVKLGWISTSYTMPVNLTQRMGSISFGGLFLGVGGDLPIRREFGALLSLDFQFLASATETGFSSGAANAPTSVYVFVGGYYRPSQRLSFRAGVDVAAHSVSFSNGATISQRMIAFAPSVVYYF